MAVVCDVLEISRSALYAWRQGDVGPRAASDQALSARVQEVFREHRRRYGARRVAKELQAQGESCGRQRAGKLLNSLGLRAIQPKSFKPRTTESRHKLGYSPQLLLEHPGPTRLNEVWVADITYVPLEQRRFGYLSVILDLWSRRVIGWEFALDMTETLVIGALLKSIKTRSPLNELIHHSDRGGQYAGTQYRALLARSGIQQSMSRSGNCYDNAFMESCFGTIKTELEMTDYRDEIQARAELASYIAYYNAKRLHSSLDYQTPLAFEQAQDQTTAPPG